MLVVQVCFFKMKLIFQIYKFYCIGENELINIEDVFYGVSENSPQSCVYKLVFIFKLNKIGYKLTLFFSVWVSAFREE